MNRTPVADWQQLSVLYELADTLDVDALDAWLVQLRGQAHPLLPQLKQMLAARAQVQHNGFLDTLPRLPAPREPRAIEWQAGSRIGSYRLLRKLGSGGMAEVWLAQRDDGAFARQVAIKLLFRHAGSNERDNFAQRFDRERDILASLDHPHISALHDAGVTPGGQPWLALEYVEGQTLTASCDSRCLGIDARVRLFRQVLLAVQHAHANLVIHRDLKPGNILVTGQGEVRLLDFGIAKLLEPEGAAADETELTRMAGRPMTLQYAAPEQLLGQPLTTACDVYALGVVLYELLCGERPYELKVDSAAQLEQAILDTEPRAPSRRALAESAATARGTSAPALRKQLASDLDAIVLRALAKQPAQRYGSVEAMRADLDRWLGGEPVEARAPSTVYRVGKFVRRHTLSLSLGAGAVLALVCVATLAVVMGLQARQDSARAVASRDFMLNIFQRANQEKSHGADITARDLLETGRRDVLTRLAGQPRLQVELLRGIAKIQGDMGEYAAAGGTLTELVRVLGELREPREQAVVRLEQARNALQMNNLAMAERFLTAAQTLPGRPKSDADLNARMAEVAGWLLLNSGDARAAKSLLLDGRRAATKALGPEHLRTFKLGQALVRMERESGNFDAALGLQEELRAIAGRVQGLDASEVAAIDWETVNVLVGAGRFAQALSLAQTALPHCVHTLGAQDQSCRYLFLKEQQTLLRLGRVDLVRLAMPRVQSMAQDATLPFLQIEALLLAFRVSALKPVAFESAALFEQVRAFGQSRSEVAMPTAFKAAALLALAESRLRHGDTGGARQWAELAMKRLGDGALRGDGLRLASIGRMLIGIALMKQGRADIGLIWLEQSQSGLAEVLGTEHPTTQLFAMNNVLALAATHRSYEALSIAKHAGIVLREVLGDDSPTYQNALALERWLDRNISGLPRDASEGARPDGTDFFS